MRATDKLRVRANCQEHAKEIQKVLFDLGIYFGGSSSHGYSRLDNQFIYINSKRDGWITVGGNNSRDSEDYFNSHESTEVTLRDLIKMKEYV